jgi:hypothetical protein
MQSRQSRQSRQYRYDRQHEQHRPHPARSELWHLLDAAARDGVAAHEAALGPIAAAARASALSPVLVDVLLDASAPPVARERALARIVRGLLDRLRAGRTAAGPGAGQPSDPAGGLPATPAPAAQRSHAEPPARPEAPAPAAA